MNDTNIGVILGTFSWGIFILPTILLRKAKQDLAYEWFYTLYEDISVLFKYCDYYISQCESYGIYTSGPRTACQH